MTDFLIVEHVCHFFKILTKKLLNTTKPVKGNALKCQKFILIVFFILL